MIRRLAGWIVIAGIVAFAVFSAYESFHPWTPASPFLREHPGDVPVVVGASYGTGCKYSGALRPAGICESRTYVLIPSIFFHPYAIRIEKYNDESPTIQRSIEPLVLFILVLGAFAGFFPETFRLR